jgi:hypothetical protein
MHFLSLCPSSLAVLEDTKTKRLAMIPEGERALFLKELLQAEMKARNVGQAQGAAALWWPAFFSFFFLLPPALIHTFGLKYPEMLCLASDHPAIIHTTASLHHHRSLRAPLGGRDGPHCASVLFSAATGQRGRLGDP